MYGCVVNGALFGSEGGAAPVPFRPNGMNLGGYRGRGSALESQNKKKPGRERKKKRGGGKKKKKIQ